MADDEEAWLAVRGGSLPRRRAWGERRFEAQTMRRQQIESTPGRDGSECKGPALSANVGWAQPAERREGGQHGGMRVMSGECAV